MESHQSPRTAPQWLPQRLRRLGWTAVAADAPPTIVSYLCGDPVSSTDLYADLVKIGKPELMLAVQGGSPSMVPTLDGAGIGAGQQPPPPPKLKFNLRFAGTGAAFKQLVEKLAASKSGIVGLHLQPSVNAVDDMSVFVACCWQLHPATLTLRVEAQRVAQQSQAQVCAILLDLACDAAVPLECLDLSVSSTDLFKQDEVRRAFQALPSRLRVLKLGAPLPVLSQAGGLIAGQLSRPQAPQPIKLESLALMYQASNSPSDDQAGKDWAQGWIALLRSLLQPNAGLTTLQLDRAPGASFTVWEALGAVARNRQIAILQTPVAIEPRSLGDCIVRCVLTRNLRRRDRGLTGWFRQLAGALSQQTVIGNQPDIVDQLAANFREVAPADDVVGNAFLKAATHAPRRPDDHLQALIDDELDQLLIETVAFLLDNDFMKTASRINLGLEMLRALYREHYEAEELRHADNFGQLAEAVKLFFQLAPDASTRRLPPLAAGAPDCVLFTREWLGSGFLDFSDPPNARPPIRTGTQMVLGSLHPMVSDLLSQLGRYIIVAYPKLDRSVSAHLLAELSETIVARVLLPWLKQRYCTVMGVPLF